MRVTLQLLPTKRTKEVLELERGATVADAVRRLGLYPDGWVPVKGDGPIPTDAILEDGDEIKLISVVSGG